jgi:hypothetical protein
LAVERFGGLFAVVSWDFASWRGVVAVIEQHWGMICYEIHRPTKNISG